MNAPNVKVLKVAITIMTIMIILGISLLFYGIATKSSKVMTENQPVTEQAVPAIASNIELLKSCEPRLVSVVGNAMYFAYDNASDPNCPVAISIDRNTGATLQVYNAK